MSRTNPQSKQCSLGVPILIKIGTLWSFFIRQRTECTSCRNRARKNKKKKLSQIPLLCKSVHVITWCLTKRHPWCNLHCHVPCTKEPMCKTNIPQHLHSGMPTCLSPAGVNAAFSVYRKQGEVWKKINDPEAPVEPSDISGSCSVQYPRSNSFGHSQTKLELHGHKIQLGHQWSPIQLFCRLTYLVDTQGRTVTRTLEILFLKLSQSWLTMLSVMGCRTQWGEPPLTSARAF